MKKKEFMVKEISSDGVIVVPFDKNGCAGCGGSCSGCHVTVLAKNTKNLPVKPGCLVSLSYPGIFQKVFNVCTVLVPVICAVLCFVFSPSLSKLFQVRCTEGFKSAVSLAGFVFPAVVFFFAARNKSHFSELQVMEITHN